MVMDCLGRCFKSVSSISYKYGKLGETVSESRTLAVKNGTTGETSGTNATALFGRRKVWP